MLISLSLLVSDFLSCPGDAFQIIPIAAVAVVAVVVAVAAVAATIVAIVNSSVRAGLLRLRSAAEDCWEVGRRGPTGEIQEGQIVRICTKSSAIIAPQAIARCYRCYTCVVQTTSAD